MKSRLLVILLLVVSPSILPATEPPPTAAPVVLETYNVKERPFGFLGIKHATIALHPLKLIVGMKSLRFLQIDELEPGSPGIAAGIQPGDRIVSIDGVKITEIGLRRLKRMGREIEAGAHLRVEFLRPSDGSTRLVEITVPPRPKRPQP